MSLCKGLELYKINLQPYFGQLLLSQSVVGPEEKESSLKSLQSPWRSCPRELPWKAAV